MDYAKVSEVASRLKISFFNVIFMLKCCLVPWASNIPTLISPHLT